MPRFVYRGDANMPGVCVLEKPSISVNARDLSLSKYLHVAVLFQCFISNIVARLRGPSKAPPGQYTPYRPAVRAIYTVALTVYTTTN